ncbi:MAG: hypothetical protein KKH41_07340 [Candidatus Thermoplasmatota archaeon]|nr:hypothetical protein [Euryarchaeota archaeon]MBU4031695.1 hypothetical protein [Candidatus Thermoplasmatota archaeon]MBU4071345.1 hypothetical protein [Candidatus Thermoplasmatota archaeon]MBU4144621.1 hypothetical protein [Candidatus Thermoplasmatota archaeon]MBU4592381.1 hypothetical protein [Candidatus Thermoplasmatota archaeon]
MSGKWGDDAVAGSFEELPALLVVLIAISLFSVSVAHATMSWDDSDDYVSLQEDCATFAGMVSSSSMLCVEGHPGVYDYSALQNISEAEMLEEFNTTLFGFEYRISIQCLDLESGNITFDREIITAEQPKGSNAACFNTCVNVMQPAGIGAARLSVTIWRPAE